MGIIAPIVSGGGLTSTGFSVANSMGGRRSSLTSLSSRPQTIPQSEIPQFEELSSKFMQNSKNEQQEGFVLNQNQNRSYVDNPELKQTTLKSMLDKLNGIQNE